MTFTVNDALKVGPLRLARVLAGTEGLNRTLSYVNVMEVPDILKWVKRDELLLTTLYPMRDMTISPAELIRELSQRSLAGIAVKIGRGDWSPNMAKIEAKGGQAWVRACSGHNWACWEVGQK